MSAPQSASASTPAKLMLRKEQCPICLSERANDPVLVSKLG
jgi:hypothetical protein